MKKIISILMAALMLCALCVTASATTELQFGAGQWVETKNCPVPAQGSGVKFVENILGVISEGKYMIACYTYIPNEQSPDQGEWILARTYSVDTNEILSMQTEPASPDLQKMAEEDVTVYTSVSTILTDEALSRASALSEGSMTIVVGVAGIAVGMAVMFFIMKKKPALAESEN